MRGSARTASATVRSPARPRRATSSSLTIRPSRILIARFALSADAGVVRHDDQREPVGVQLAEELHHLLGGLGVERAGGLVGPHDARPARERAGDGDPLLLATRELRRAGASVRAPRPTRSSVSDARPARLLRVDSREQERQLRVLDRAEHGDEVVRLEDEAHRRRRGSPVRRASESACRSTPSRSTRPPSMSSRPEQQLSRVVLPEPDGPMTETNSPSCTTRSTSRSASTSSAPVWYVLRTRSATNRRGRVGSVTVLHRQPALRLGTLRAERLGDPIGYRIRARRRRLRQLLRAAGAERRHGLGDVTGRPAPGGRSGRRRDRAG